MERPLSPVTFDRVTLQDAFWLPRLQTLKSTTLPFALDKVEPAVENLRRCGNIRNGRGGESPFPHRFVSSDLYKVMEGAACLLALGRDPDLEARIDAIIDVIADAQQDDGYLYVSHICGVARPEEMGERPYSYVVHSHELYNMGHMYEGAVAYARATGKRAWLDVAEKSARHIHRAFFEGDPAYNDGTPVGQAPGHQEIELALCKMAALTGEQLYLETAQRLIDIRGVTFRPDGEETNSPEYAQQHCPAPDQDAAVGHAVRAAYYYSGMADVGAAIGDGRYDDALDRIWRNIVDAKMHITGGLGAVRGIEGFGPDYELPNFEAYNETCAAIANVLFNTRLCLLHGDAKYFDVAEVALLNNALAGVNLDGDRFFYVNPLESDGESPFNQGTASRAPWFDCACCPSNITRTLPQVPGTMYATAGDEVYTLLYGANSVTLDLPAGSVRLEQTTDYPFDGTIAIRVGTDAPTEFALKLRIPTWTTGRFVPGELYRYVSENEEAWTLAVNGATIPAEPVKGFVEVRRTWADGAEVVLTLPMPVRLSTCDERVEANRGRVAVTRGPLVYCAEEVDNDGAVQRFSLPRMPGSAECGAEAIEGGPLAGVVEVTVPVEGGDGPLHMVPYFAWNNRGEGSMIVWLPRQQD